MAIAYELNAGQAEKSAGANNTIKYTRTWKVVKATRNESYNVPALIGVDTGSQWPGGGEVYCTNITDSPDGDSMMVRIITATYASPANAAGGGGGGGGGKSGGGSSSRQPGRDIGQAPNVRPAVVTIDSSYEMTSEPAWYHRPGVSADRVIATQPTGELVSDLTMPQPTATITVAYFTTNLSPVASFAVARCGYVNSVDWTVQGKIFAPRTVMLRSVSARPCTEEWGGTTYKGTNWTYTFAWRQNYQYVLDTLDADGVATSDSQTALDIGWDIAVPLRGMNCKQEMSATYPCDPFAINLLRDENGIVFGAAQAAPPAVGPGEGPIRVVLYNNTWRTAYYSGTTFLDLQRQNIWGNGNSRGKIGKAMTVSPTTHGGFSQSPSSQPIPLNPDGTPRARYAPDGAVPADADYLFRGKIKSAANAVLSYRRGIYPSTDFNALGIRW